MHRDDLSSPIRDPLFRQPGRADESLARVPGGRIDTPTGHSEPPWSLVTGGGPNLYLVGARSPDPVTQARHLYIGEVYLPGVYASQAWDNLSLHEAVANAQLVATAPELLAAAYDLVKDRSTAPNSTGRILDAWERLRQAVVRAHDIQAASNVLRYDIRR